MSLLTPEDVGDLAPKFLSNSLTELRQQLGDYIEVDRGSIAMSSPSAYSLDTRDVESGPPTLSPAFDAQAARRWIDLYRGDFLEGLSLQGLAELQEWSNQEGERLRATYVRGLRAIARAALKSQDSETGLKALERLRSSAQWDVGVCARRVDRWRAGLAESSGDD